MKGVLPVKFIERNELIVIVNKKSERPVKMDVQGINIKSIIPAIVPVMIPLSANSLTGINGNITGVIKTPEMIPAASAENPE